MRQELAHGPDVLPVGIEQRKLRPDLIRNITTHSHFPFHIWLWQFVPKTTEMRAVIRSTVAKKCRFWWIWEIHTEMEAGDCGEIKSFLTIR
jgi:hypothetical protein